MLRPLVQSQFSRAPLIKLLPFISPHLPRKTTGSSHTCRSQYTCEIPLSPPVSPHAPAFSRRDPEASQDTNAEGCVTLESQPAVRSTLCRPYLANATPSSLGFPLLIRRPCFIVLLFRFVVRFAVRFALRSGLLV